MHNPGKYNDACTVAREATDGELVLLIVVGGNKGSGFSVQGKAAFPQGVIVDTLRAVANEIEKQQNANPCKTTECAWYSVAGPHPPAYRKDPCG